MAESNAVIGRAFKYGVRVYGSQCVAQEAIWLNRLLENLEFRMLKPITIYEDYKAAIIF
jgi:hypothetical protein